MDTLIDPVTVRMTKERNNSILAGALPSLRTVTDLHYKKVCAVLGRLDPIMRATSDAVAKASMGAQQEPGAVAFGWLLGGETFSLWSLAGGALVLAGVWMIFRKAKPAELEECETALPQG